MKHLICCLSCLVAFGVVAHAVEVKTQNYRLELNEAGKGKVTVAAREALKIENLWTLEFYENDAVTGKRRLMAEEFLSAPWNGKVTSRIDGQTLVMRLESPRLSMELRADCHSTYIDWSARIAKTDLPVSFLALPASVELGLTGMKRVVFPLRGADGLGVAYKPAFFAEHRYPNCRYRAEVVGTAGYEHLYGGGLTSLGDHEPIHPVKVTETGRQWFPNDVVNAIEKYELRVNRPPAKGQADVVLVENECGAALSGTQFGGKGWLFRFGGNGNDKRNEEYGQNVFITMVNGTMSYLVNHQKADFQGKKFGLVMLKNGPVHGNWTPGTVLGWQKHMEKAMYCAACKGEFVVLNSPEEMDKALADPSFAMILNPYGELFPALTREALLASLDKVRDFVRRGGVWWEVGGYPFYCLLVPDPYLAVSVNYTSAVADFSYADYGSSSVAFYGIQPMMRVPWERERLLKPCRLSLSGRGQAASYEHGWFMSIGGQESWQSPVLRMSFAHNDVRRAMDEYAKVNDIHGSLERKIPDATLREKLKASMLIRLHGNNAESQINGMEALPKPSLVHYSEYLHGGFDKQYPDHLPPRPSWGTGDDFKRFIMTGKSMGHLMMPYTNTSWWCTDPNGPTFEREGTAPLLVKRNGTNNLERYSSNTGYSLCFWHPAVQAAHRKVRHEMTVDYPSDVLFQDQVGARQWVWNFHELEPYKASGYDGMHSLTMEDAKVVPMATEDGHDRVLNFETMICGCAWASVPAGGNRSQQHLRYRYPDGEWEFYPILSFLGHDQCLFTTHDLGHFTDSEDKLASTLAFGYGLSLVWSDYQARSAAAYEWLHWLGAIQKTICVQYAGRKLLDFRYLAGEAPDGLVYAQYDGGIATLVNLGEKPVVLERGLLAETAVPASEQKWLAGRALCGYGFYLSAPNACAAYMQTTTGQKAGFVVDGRDGKPKGMVYAGVSTEVELPTDIATNLRGMKTAAFTTRGGGRFTVPMTFNPAGNSWNLAMPGAVKEAFAIPAEITRKSPRELGYGNKVVMLFVDKGASEQFLEGGRRLAAEIRGHLAGSGLELEIVKSPHELYGRLQESDRGRRPLAVVSYGAESLYVPNGMTSAEVLQKIKAYVDHGGVWWCTGGYPFHNLRLEKEDGSYEGKVLGSGGAATFGVSCPGGPIVELKSALEVTEKGKTWFGAERSARIAVASTDVQRPFITTQPKTVLVRGGGNNCVTGVRSDGWGYLFSAAGFMTPVELLADFIAGTTIHLYQTPWEKPGDGERRICWRWTGE